MAGEDSLSRAMELLEAGNWQDAHTIVQKHKTPLAAWLHGIVHILEGDLDNAKGWYGRSERAYPGPAAVKDELVEARRAVDAA